MHALILSDLHVGARNCQHTLIQQRLASSSLHTVDSIILNGDVVDHLNFENYRSADWQIIARLQQLAREQRLHVIQGNHDRPRRTPHGCISHSLLSDVLRLDIQTEMTLFVENKRFLIVHGDQFDQTLNMSTVGYLAEAFYRQTQRWHQPTSRWLKRQSKQLLGIERIVRMKALDYARLHGFDGIILGHTHYADDSLWENGCRYLNTGSWVDDTCTYLEVMNECIVLQTWCGEIVPIKQPLHDQELSGHQVHQASAWGLA